MVMYVWKNVAREAVLLAFKMEEGAPSQEMWSGFGNWKMQGNRVSPSDYRMECSSVNTLILVQ